MDGIGLGFGNILDEMRVEMVKIDLGILNLSDWLVGGEGGERGDSGGHLGHEIVHLRLALPLIDLLHLGLVLGVREGGAGRPDGADLWSSHASGSRASRGS